MAARTRRALLAVWLPLTLAACGGGGGGSGNAPDAPATPAIEEFSADRERYAVGEAATLRVRFSGGQGRIEPALGAVQSGALVQTGALDATRRLRLVVEAAGQPPAVRELVLPVAFRHQLARFEAPPMAFHTTVATTDGGAIVIGGSRGLGVLSDAVERFDPATRTFTRIGSLASGRAEHSALSLGDGRILVVGGVRALGGLVAELVDERSGEVTPAGALVQPRIRHAAVRLADGRVLVLGGANRNTAEIWEPATRRWRLLDARLAHLREYATATLLADGQVLVVGGDDAQAAADPVFAELFDPATERFTPLTAAATGATVPGERRWLHGAWRQADGSVIVAGGEGAPSGSNDVTANASVWRYDPASRRFTPQAALGEVRTLVAGVMTPDDELLLFGGEGGNGLVTATGVAWRGGARNAQKALPLLPSGRAWHTVTRLADGRVLVLGGSDERNGTFAAGAALYE